MSPSIWWDGCHSLAAGDWEETSVGRTWPPMPAELAAQARTVSNVHTLTERLQTRGYRSLRLASTVFTDEHPRVVVAAAGGIPAATVRLDPFVQVEIWSDVVCPWCYIGKRRFERALEGFAHRDEVTIVWRSFELDRHAPAERVGSYAELLGRKYGMGPDRAQRSLQHMTDVAAEEGLTFDFGGVRPGNTFDAHRLLHLAAGHGLQEDLKERFLRAYFTDNEPVGDRGTLARLAIEVGLDAGEVQAVLEGEAYADHVRADEAAAEELGVTGVPFFVLDRRLAVSGAQDTEVFVRALDRAWAKAHPLEMVGPTADGEDCADGSCAV